MKKDETMKQKPSDSPFPDQCCCFEKRNPFRSRCPICGLPYSDSLLAKICLAVSQAMIGFIVAILIGLLLRCCG
jgi:hypothetical protein